jgi:YidC/Oxa1 family membrane protein insertase
MDKTAWIVVTLCLVGMGICWHLMKEARPPNLPPTVEQAGNGNGNPGGQPPGNGGVENGGGKPVDSNPAPQRDVDEVFNHIETASVRWTFTNWGGGIKEALILPPDFTNDQPTILNANARGPIGAISSGVGRLETAAYQLKSAEGQSPVVYEATLAEGILARKTYTLSADAKSRGYLWDFKLEIENSSASSYRKELFVYTGNVGQATPNDFVQPSFGWSADDDSDNMAITKFKSGGFMGFGRKGDTPSDLNRQGSHSNWTWLAVYNQFYTTQLSPRTAPDVTTQYWVEYFEPSETAVEGANPGRLHMGVGPGAVIVDTGSTFSREYELYIGPRSYNILHALDKASVNEGRASNREDVLFYGWFSVVSRFLMVVLTFFQGLVAGFPHSWGIAIVILTICIRIVIWPLHAKSHRSMKRMALLSPKMAELKEKHPDNPQKVQQEMMKMYRDYGVSPVGSCLPILLQFPIFLGYFRMLQSASELRGKSFLWTSDLSVPDTVATLAGIDINPLPIVMTITMFIQMKMTPKSGDKNVQAQQRIFMFMPFIFLFICYNFASALALYWTVQNIFGIGQTLIMKRMPEPKLEKRAPREPPQPPGQKPKKKKPRPPRTGG